MFAAKSAADFATIRDQIQTMIAAPEPVASRPAPASVAEELMKLASLRDAGVLTEDEFAVQKARLLS